MVQIVDKLFYELPVINWAEGKPTCIVAHETANNSNNGSYKNEIDFMKNNWQNAFVHSYTGEIDTALVHDPDIGGAWGAGPSMHHYAIHCELCRSSTKEGFIKAYNNWVETLIYFAKEYDIPVILNRGTNKEGTLTHQYVTETYGGTTHVDPDAYLNHYGVTINQLAMDLQSSFDDDKTEKKPQSTDEEIELNVETSIVDYLNAHDKDSSFNHRQELADQYGIEGYIGSAEQNLALLDAIRSYEPSESIYEGESIVEYLNIIGDDSSFNHRSELAEVYGIDHYAGSAEQNLQLLDMLRSGVEPDTSSNKKMLYLPANVNLWNVYKLNVQPVSRNSEWALTPSAFGGLTYEILAMPYPNVATIMTSRGKRNIYVAPSTGANIQ